MSKLIFAFLASLGTYAHAQSVEQVIIGSCAGLGDVWIKFDLEKQSAGSGNTIFINEFTLDSNAKRYTEKNSQLTRDKETYDLTLTVDGVAHACKSDAVSG